MIKTLWDEHFTRYQLIQATEGSDNWLFLPGGPGGDSCYFLPLIHTLKLAGNVWLVDFPANGSNIKKVNPDYPFDQWEECLLATVKKFPSPILVGHSFGGMFPLLFPELEHHLKAVVLLNSAPSLWLEEAAKVAQEKQIPLLTEPLLDFEKKPSPATFKKALLACAPYYFPPRGVEEGKKLLESLPFNYHAAVWWLKKAPAIHFNAKWIPQKVPTLILGGSEDCITPVSLFSKDIRFQRENMMQIVIQNAGHFPWLEQKEAVYNAFHSFLKNFSIL